jgi:sulfate adenylyltransferase
MTKAKLIPPYGGKLVNLVVEGKEREDLLARAGKLPSIKITMRNMCDLELIATGGFSPLTTFMGKADYDRVLKEMRLADGTLFPLPITLTADPKELPTVGDELALRSANFDLIAVMTLDEVYHWDAEIEAAHAYGSTDSKHPMVSEMARWNKVCISGPMKVVNLPKYYDFVNLRHTPAQVRAMLEEMGHDNVVAFQTRNPLHRIHEELTKRAAAEVKGSLIVHPVVGMTKPGDVDHYTRVRTYKALVDNYYDKKDTMLSLLPLAMRMAGPKEALLHAIIRRNHGANHFIVGRDHAGPGNDSSGKPFYGPYDAQEVMKNTKRNLASRWFRSRCLSIFPMKIAMWKRRMCPRAPKPPTSPAHKSAMIILPRASCSLNGSHDLRPPKSCARCTRRDTSRAFVFGLQA